MAPSDNFSPPTPLDFTPKMLREFSKYSIRRTSLASLWGQDSFYFREPELELNAGPRQNDDSGIKYQQDWIEKRFVCPFCGHDHWNFSYACKLKEAEAEVYDPQGLFYVLLCPKCERAVEAIPRKLVDG